MVLGQQKVEGKSNEITAILELLDLLVIKGCVVTIDAMGCQEKIATKITEKEGDYILAVKENQAFLMDDIKEAFEHEKASGILTYSKSNFGHGRVETRSTSIINHTDWVSKPERWSELKSLIMVKAEREDKKNREEGGRDEILYK